MLRYVLIALRNQFRSFVFADRPMVANRQFHIFTSQSLSSTSHSWRILLAITAPSFLPTKPCFFWMPLWIGRAGTDSEPWKPYDSVSVTPECSVCILQRSLVSPSTPSNRGDNSCYKVIYRVWPQVSLFQSVGLSVPVTCHAASSTDLQHKLK